MTGYLSSKMKRKDFEQVYDDFSDFSLSSPARKIRRLDAELLPIMEEESGIPLDFDQPELVTEEVQSSSNEERALVLYKQVNTPLLQSSGSSNFSITVNSDLIPGFKSQVLRSNQSNLLKSMEEKSSGTDNSWAVVPWVPSKRPPPATRMDTPTIEPSEPMEEPPEPMEAEEEDGKMEIEDAQEILRMGEGEVGGLPQWQQQHCLTPQLPQSAPTPPITWSW